MAEPEINCTCPKVKCERHQHCEACTNYHTQKGKLPHCQRKKKRFLKMNGL